MKSTAFLLVITFFAFFSPVAGICLAVAMAIVIDTILGVWASIKSGRRFRSVYLRTGLVRKMFVYQLVIIGVYVIDVHITAQVIDMKTGIDLILTRAAALLLIYIEAKSIDENFERIFKVSISKSLIQLVKRAKSLKKDIDDIAHKP